MRKSQQLSSAVRCIAAAAIIAVLFALANRPTMRSTPLSPAEVAIVGTWTYPGVTSGVFHTITFNADRTCVFDGPPSKYPGRWRIDGGKLVFHHTYQTVIGRTPICLPTAVESLELPSFMAKTEEIRRPVSFSRDGCNMTLENIPGIAACTLTRTEATVPSNRENNSGRTMP
jgi:hypothetical protein